MLSLYNIFQNKSWVLQNTAPLLLFQNTPKSITKPGTSSLENYFNLQHLVLRNKSLLQNRASFYYKIRQVLQNKSLLQNTAVQCLFLWVFAQSSM